jgi:D-alanyl-D-alanine carboxypeptidase
MILPSRSMNLCAATGLLLLSAGAAPVAGQDAPARFGHLAYKEAAQGELRAAGRYRATDRVVQLAAPAAEAFAKLRAAAQTDGVKLVPISGFRTVEYQRGLFHRAIERYGSAARAARWVAPPGHSEHHTGLALDIGDESEPDCDTEPCFVKTRAFEWLKKNAARFGFELSFPQNHGAVSYEPWHWRFIGDDSSKKVFAAAREKK